MIEALAQQVNGDEALVRRWRFRTTTFLLEIGADLDLRRQGGVGGARTICHAFVSFCAARPGRGMGKILEQPAAAGRNDLMALIKRRVLKAEGDLQVFMANLRYFKEALAKLRHAGAEA